MPTFLPKNGILIVFSFAVLFLADQVVGQDKLAEAKELYETEQYQSAREILEPLRAKQENDTAIQSLLGSVYGKLELWEKSADQLEGLVEDYPDNAQYQFRYGGALGIEAKNSSRFTAMMMLDDVKYHLKQATKLDKNHINSRWALVQLYVELPTIIGGTKSNAMEFANQLENISPVDGALAKGFVEKSEGNYEEAEKQLKKAVELGQSAMTYTKLTELYVEMNRENKALQTIEKGISQTSDLDCKIKFAELAVKYQQKQKSGVNYLKSINTFDVDTQKKERIDKLLAELED